MGSPRPIARSATELNKRNSPNSIRLDLIDDSEWKSPHPATPSPMFAGLAGFRAHLDPPGKTRFGKGQFEPCWHPPSLFSKGGWNHVSVHPRRSATASCQRGDVEAYLAANTIGSTGSGARLASRTSGD